MKELSEPSTSSRLLCNTYQDNRTLKEHKPAKSARNSLSSNTVLFSWQLIWSWGGAGELVRRAASHWADQDCRTETQETSRHTAINPVHPWTQIFAGLSSPRPVTGDVDQSLLRQPGREYYGRGKITPNLQSIGRVTSSNVKLG